MPLTQNQWDGSNEGDNDIGNANNWQLIHVGSSTERVVISAGTAAIAINNIGALTWGELQADGFGSSLRLDLAQATVLGDAQIDNLSASGVDSLVALGGNLSSTGGKIAITSFTGSAKTITVNTGVLDLANSTVPATYLLAANTGGTFKNFTILSPNATGGRSQNSIALGGTISGTYQSAAFTPTGATIGGTAVTGFSAAAGAWSGVVAAGTSLGSQTPKLTRAASGIIVNMADVTVTATASAIPSQSLSMGIGLRL